MNEQLNRLNQRADQVDQDARDEYERRKAAARALHARSAPWTAVRDLDELPAPLPVVGLSVVARLILALVAKFVREGYDGLEVGLWELSYRLKKGLSTVQRARDQLVDKGWLVKVPQFIPAAETKLLGPYVTAQGKYRSLRADDPNDPDAYGDSQDRNVYTLGSLAVAAGFGERCGQPGGQPGEQADEQATLSASSSGSGSDSGSASPDRRRPCGFVDNPSVGPEIEGSASSPRSTFALSERDGDSLLEATHSDGATAPLVADAQSVVLEGSDGDGSEAVNRESARRGLFATMGHGIARFLGRRGDA